MKKLLLCVSLSAVLVGCGRDFGAPLVAGEVVTFENRHEVGREALSQEQLQALNAWFEKHRSGWHGLIAPDSSEPPELRLNLTHADGKTTSVNVVAQANGGHYLRLTNSEKWAYSSASGAFKSWAAVRPVSNQELTAMRSLLPSE